MSNNPAAVLVDATGSFVGVPGLPLVVVPSGPILIDGILHVSMSNSPFVGISGSVTVLEHAITTTGSLPVFIVNSLSISSTGSLLMTGSVGITGPVSLLSGSVSKPLFAEPTGGRITIMSGSTVTTNGFSVVTWQGWSEWYLICNASGSVGGTSPGLQFKIEEIDPIDKITVIGQTVTGSYLTSSLKQDVLEIVDTVTDTFKISWTIYGTTPFFSGVNVSWVGHAGGNAVEGQTHIGEIVTDPPIPIAGVDSYTRAQYIKVDDIGRILVTSAGANASTKGFVFGTIVLSTTVVTPIRSTTYTEQITNAQRSIVSANAADTAAGTGARTVKLTYFDQTCAGPFTELITLSGTTPVNTTALDICFIEKIEVLTVGSGGVNAGIISLKAATAGAGATIWTIAAGKNRTNGAHHYVPNDKTSFITGFVGGIKGADTTGILLKAKNPTNANSAENQISDVLRVPSSGQSTRNYDTPIPVIGPAKITAYAAPDSTSSRTYYGSFDFYEE